MHIARKKETKKIQVSDTMTAHEYPLIDASIHGAIVELNGRYPEKGRVINEKCSEIGFVIKGTGKLIVEGEEVKFKEGDQLFIKPGEKYYWIANAIIFMSCAPAWYPEQHKEVD